MDEAAGGRLFFALWPDAAARAALGRLAAALQPACGGRAVPASNIHLTLAFLGNVPQARFGEACAAADGIAAPCFDLEISTVEYWGHNRIVWAGPRHCPHELERLAHALAGALAARGLRTEPRPYAPHVTLLRNARHAPARIAALRIRWPVSQFVLAQSLRRAHGAAYVLLRRWPLAARA